MRSNFGAINSDTINHNTVSMRSNFGAINSDTESAFVHAINHNTVSMRCIFGAINNDTGKHYQSVIVPADAWNVLQGQF